MKRAIIIQGAPGVGKTTLARRLGDDLGIKSIVKDDIKECLYESLGAPNDRTESELFGRIAIRSLFCGLDEFIKAKRLVIIESTFVPEYAVTDLAPTLPLSDLLQIYVYCDPRLQETRFSNRIKNGSRHKGHIDKTIDAKALQQRHSAIPGVFTISVDTTDFSEADYQQLLGGVRSALEGGSI